MSLSTLLAPLSNVAHAGHTHDATAAAAGVLLFLLVFVVATYILTSIMLARIFQKAGVEGWKAWVPVYNTWVMLELGDQKGWWALVMLIPLINIVAIVFMYIAMYNIGLRFGKDDYFVLWAIFLPLVWYAWLAFDNSTWKKTAPTTASEPSNQSKE